MKACFLVLSLFAAVQASAKDSNAIIDPPHGTSVITNNQGFEDGIVRGPKAPIHVTLNSNTQQGFEDGIVRLASSQPDRMSDDDRIVPFLEDDSNDDEDVEPIELNPYAPETAEVLRKLERSTDFKAPVNDFSPLKDLVQNAAGCYRDSCPVYVYINLSERPQQLRLYVNGVLNARWLVSGGKKGHGTRSWDGNPGGYIATDYYDSKKYPEGDYMGLGNMPYAMFYSGGFALHGTTTGAFKRLGTPASHGCIRMHPNDAYYLNTLVHEVGARQTWFQIVR